MRSFTLLAALILVAAASRVTVEHAFTLPTPAGWTNTDVAARPTTSKDIIVGLTQSNKDVLETLFWERSDPKHSDYGRALNHDEITEIISPSEETIATAMAWLESYGIAGKLSYNRDFILATATVAQLEKLVETKFTVFANDNGEIAVGSMGPYSVPASVRPHVTLVAGIVGLPYRRPASFAHLSSTGTKSSSGTSGKTTSTSATSTSASSKATSSSTSPTSSATSGTSATTSSNPSDLWITPTVIREAYAIPHDLVATNSGNMQAVAEFQAQYYCPSDLTSFFQQYVNYSTADTIYKVDGANHPKGDGVSLEASLDTQYIMSTAPNVKTWFYSYASTAFYFDVLRWLVQLDLTNDNELPYVFSVSYGSQGDYPSKDFQNACDTQFQKLGVRMRSVIIASGDYGAGCQGAERNSETSVSENCDGVILDPSYPATSLYVTSVGATKFINGNSGEEAAVSWFKSGGGFSWTFPQPPYQATAVRSYLNSGVILPPSTAFNAAGRGTPDVAALGDIHFQVIDDGQLTPVGGTSASTPVFAGIVTLLNDIRLNNKNSTLGFLNPWIYDVAVNHPEAFNDITVGSNFCGGTPASSTGGTSGTSGGSGGSSSPFRSTPAPEGCGFLTAPGWDPVTGVGTPNYSQLKLYV